MPHAPPPAFVRAVSPTGTVDVGAQIRVTFARDIVPLEALEGTAHAAALEHFTIAPKLAGRFVVWTPRMVGFVAEAPLPPATRVRVTVSKGLRDLEGNELAQDYAWTFQTPPIELQLDLPQTAPHPDDLEASVLDPAVALSSNAALSTESIAAHAHFVAGTQSVAATVSAPSSPPSPEAQESGEQAQPTFAYTLHPASSLAKGTLYHLEVAPGVEPIGGNVPSAGAAGGYLRTFGDLTLGGAVLAPGDDARFRAGDPSLQFSNALDPKTDLKGFTIDPKPKDVPRLFNLSGSTIAINPYALEPATAYTVTVPAGIADVFGQHTSASLSAKFSTSDLAPALWLPTGFKIFPSSSDVKLNIETTNVAYRSGFTKVAPEALIRTSASDANSLVAPSGEWTEHPKGPAVTAVSIRDRLGAPSGMLAYGASAVVGQTRGDDGKLHPRIAEYYGTVALTDVGLSVTQFPGELLVRTAHLSDGSALGSANVTVYPSLAYAPAGAPRTNPEPCATGTTSAAGELEVAGAAFARCAASGTQTYGSPPLYIVARNGDDWSFARTDSYGAYFEDVPNGWSAGVPIPHGAIVADHDLFQPGETARVTGVAYFDENGRLVKARAASFTVTVTDPNGAVRTIGSRPVDRFGTFSVDVPFAKDAPLGYYAIDAKGAGGEAIGGSVRVARFKAPNFAVSVSLSNAIAPAGGSIEASSHSAYLFGAPVEGGALRWFVTRSATSFTPKGWDRFSFGRQWIYPEEQPEISSDVLQRDVKLGADANATLAVPVESSIPYPLEYRVEAQTTDVSNLSVSDRKTFIALPSAVLVGLNAPYVATAGSAFSTSVIAVDPQGKALSQKVTLVLQERVHDSATQIVEGAERPAEGVHYVDVSSLDVQTGDTPVAVQLTAPKAGEYRVRARPAGAKDDLAATDAFVWVTGPGEIDWGAQDDTRLTVKLDKASYKPGETATVLVQSPFAKADAFVAVIRHGIFTRQTRTVEGAAPAFSFTVTPDMLPNAAVQVVFVRHGAAPSSGDPGKPARVGMAGFTVPIDAKYLHVGIKPAAANALPGSHQSVAFQLDDAAHHPVAGKIVVAVVNESVLQLTGYRFPDLAQIVWASQPISVRYADNRWDVAYQMETNREAKGFGFGGGAMAGLGSDRVRTNFKSLAYFNADVQTGADGRATVSFDLPDDLTTWRVLAFGLSDDMRFGNADQTFITSKPLSANPILPQFARPGDRFEGGVAVTDTRRKGGSIDLSGTLAGGLAFDSKGTSAAQTSLSAPIAQLTQGYRFPIVVTGTGDANVTFRAAQPGASDAFSVPIAIVTAATLESVVQTGSTQDSATVPLVVAAGTPKLPGGLDLTLASTLLPSLDAAIAPALADRLPFLIPVASRVSVTASAVSLDKLYRRDSAKHRASLDRAIAELVANALPDNGFAPWPGAQRSEIYSTAFAASALGDARSAGADVAAPIARVRRYLEGVLADPGCNKDKACITSRRLEALETLVFLGDTRDDRLSEIVPAQDLLSYYERAELARVLVRLPAWHAQGLALRDKLFANVYQTSRGAVVNEPGAWIETPAAGQAQMLLLAIETKMPPSTVDALVTSLLGMRANGTWPCGCDAAEALAALTVYAGLQPEPPSFDAGARVGTQSISAAFKGYDVTTAATSIPAAALPEGKSAIVFSKTGRGTLHYVASYSYAVEGPAAGRYQGIRIDRIVRTPGKPDVLAAFGLSLPAGPSGFAVGNVFAIEDRIVLDHPVDRLVVVDPLPAGMEAVDAAFATSTQYYDAQDTNWQIDYQQIYADHVLAYASHLEAGVYGVHYIVRTVTPGTFGWPGARAYVQLEPEQFGRSASSVVTLGEPAAAR